MGEGGSFSTGSNCEEKVVDRRESKFCFLPLSHKAVSSKGYKKDDGAFGWQDSR